MKDRHVVLALVGVLSAYLVVHAGMAGFALYLFADAARQPPALVDGPYVLGAPTPFITLFAVMLALSGLCIAAFVALWRKAPYARGLWLVFSLSLLACIAVAMLRFQRQWLNYDFELAMLAVSWFFLWRAKRSEHAG
jgi:hypothetical protein